MTDSPTPRQQGLLSPRPVQQLATLPGPEVPWGPQAHPPADGRKGDCADQGERDRGFRGLTSTPWASSYAPPYRLYGVF
jgi:hypothetical protein